MNDENYERDSLLLAAILDRPDGDILNIVQAAAELPGTMYDRLSKGYHEITRAPLTQAESDSFISLVDTTVADESLTGPRVIECTPGKRYLVVHQAPNQHYPRESVMDFLGVNHILDTWSFSARPVAGTQDMPRTWILKVEEVPKTTECYVNRRHHS